MDSAVKEASGLEGVDDEKDETVERRRGRAAVGGRRRRRREVKRGSIGAGCGSRQKELRVEERLGGEQVKRGVDRVGVPVVGK